MAELKNTKPAASKAETKGTVTVKQVASGAGRFKDQIQTLTGLGLGKINRVSVLEDTASVRGMIKKVSHLIQIVN